MKKLKISSDLSLPLDVITMATAILGIRGSGKTNTAGVWAEELLKHGQQVVVIDPLNGWWGLKSSADGKRAGYPVVVFGGNHADVPLSGTEGKALADFVVERRVPCVFSLRHLNVSAQRRFVTDFSEQLFFRKGEEQHQDPVLVVIDEAHKFIPQKTFSDMTHMVHAIEALVREGRSSGIGVTLIDQRAASVNKDVLTQVELMVVHRTTAPQDKKALDEWIKDNAGEERRAEFMKSLARLALGEAWFWSVGWLDTFRRVQVRMRETFDSSATPKPGERRVTPSTLADVNLDELREQLATTIEQAKANDPAELKRKVATLERELERAWREAPPAEEKIVEKYVITDQQMENLRTLFEDVKTYTGRLEMCKFAFEDGMGKFIAELETYKGSAAARGRVPGVPGIPLDSSARQLATRAARAAERGEGTRRAKAVLGENPMQALAGVKLSNTQQRVLDALAFFESIGNFEPTNLQVGAVALLDATGGHFSNTVGPLSSAGLVQRGEGRMRLTDLGRVYAHVPDRVATLDEYHGVLRARVQKARSASKRTVDILDVVISRGGEPVTNEEIGREVGIDHTGGHYSNTIGPLSTLGLITRRDGTVRPTEILFPEGLK